MLSNVFAQSLAEPPTTQHQLRPGQIQEPASGCFSPWDVLFELHRTDAKSMHQDAINSYQSYQRMQTLSTDMLDTCFSPETTLQSRLRPNALEWTDCALAEIWAWKRSKCFLMLPSFLVSWVIKIIEKFKNCQGSLGRRSVLVAKALEPVRLLQLPPLCWVFCIWRESYK